ncbi:hypothetical protein CYY_005072 [Polysphondylium violaceum]|uniref:MD-2-related lipid-recognition domain-containing protein n=1 Tax=Polysphondylium violaceum TaxID=133409 RepID=A0A8J4PU43_9MYCE|nr:hypothetical protein CYY_005072 [Polysphondylium violaceum]
MKLVFICLIVLLISPSFCDIWNNCGTPADKFTITSIEITPNPPVKNQNVSIVLNGTLSEVVSGGNIHFLLKYGFITLVNTNFPLCGNDPFLPSPCPLQQGPISKSVTEFIPSQVPSGQYSANILIKDQNSNELACVDINLKL